ncbi:hypothetical protein [Porphyromonas loveana]|uniref:hypothetical protein n=1 Tax=Porphyromonas loveana TaxID=1884669 RepID=UPI0035A1BE52
MKRFVLMATFMVAAILPIVAQESGNAAATELPKPEYTYCEIIGTSSGVFGPKVKVVLDFGQTLVKEIVDESGKTIKFESMTDVANYMARFGWDVVQTYALTYDNNKREYHFLLKKKYISNEDITLGIITRAQYKQMKRAGK